MITEMSALLHAVQPGARIPGDWFQGLIPMNIEVGQQVMVDSSFCFRQYFSRLSVGLFLGNHVTLWRTSLSVEENGVVSIGDGSYLANASIVCTTSIRIGSGVFIAGGATIVDSDFHPIAAAARLADTVALSPGGNRRTRPPVAASPVVIGDEVWIGFNATILKGVTVGDGAIISPGAVVVHDVPAGVTVQGNPARIQ